MPKTKTKSLKKGTVLKKLVQTSVSPKLAKLITTAAAKKGMRRSAFLRQLLETNTELMAQA